MKIGELTKLDNVTVDGDVPAMTGFPEENILDENTLKVWKVEEGTVTLTIEFDSITADAICLFNLDFEYELDINVYKAGPVLNETANFTLDDLVGLESKNLLYELTDTTTAIVQIELVFTGVTTGFETFCGFIWVGDLIDFDCLEAIQPFDNSNDTATVTRANRSDFKEDYLFQSFDVTVKKENDFITLRTNIRTILETGYAQPRPFIFDEPVYDVPELILGILDSGKVGYDLFVLNDDTISQVTIGVREVF